MTDGVPGDVVSLPPHAATTADIPNPTARPAMKRRTLTVLRNISTPEAERFACHARALRATRLQRRIEADVLVHGTLNRGAGSLRVLCGCERCNMPLA
jgi:hypothetical protein